MRHVIGKDGNEVEHGLIIADAANDIFISIAFQ